MVLRLVCLSPLVCLRYGPAFENIAWSSLFLLAPLGCIYYPIEILPEFFQDLARALPLVHIFEEARHILVDKVVNYENIITAFKLNLIYLSSWNFVYFIIPLVRQEKKGR